jgi:hypothetical protein
VPLDSDEACETATEQSCKPFPNRKSGDVMKEIAELLPELKMFVPENTFDLGQPDN